MYQYNKPIYTEKESIYNKFIYRENEVIIEEKIDGSQFSFYVNCDNKLLFFSLKCQIVDQISLFKDAWMLNKFCCRC
jgi:phosphoribosylamine-glycine ligase